MTTLSQDFEDTNVPSDAEIMRWNMLPGGLVNPSSRGLYVRYEDHAALLSRHSAKPAQDGEIAALVNSLRDVAIEFHAAQQLREQISQIVVPLLKPVVEDEREAFVQWLSGTYPNAFTERGASRYWSLDHISALAWEARAALSTPPMAIELAGVTAANAEGSGCWAACSGCHELNEGHPTGPFSKVMQCNLGNGCSECGGIGAVWDTTDYQAMADAAMSTPPMERIHLPVDIPPVLLDSDEYDNGEFSMRNYDAMVRAVGKSSTDKHQAAADALVRANGGQV